MNDMQKIDHLHKRCSELLADMKRHERESIKNKKRGDQLQKEKDSSRTELSKTITLKEKLEKLCRELQKENNKLKVSHILGRCCPSVTCSQRTIRTRTKPYQTETPVTRPPGMRSTRLSYKNSMTTRKRRTILESRWSTMKWMNC
jgi:hypothetical protein